MAANRVGNIFFHAGATPPDGALACNGQAVSRTTYAALFAVIGTAWDTFNGAAAPAGTDFRVPDQDSGSESVFLRPKVTGENVGDFVASQNLQHNHTGSTNSTGNHTHTCTMWRNNNAHTSGGVTSRYTGGSTFYSEYAGDHTHSVTIDADTTGKQARPDGIVMLMCIWYK